MCLCSASRPPCNAFENLSKKVSGVLFQNPCKSEIIKKRNKCQWALKKRKDCQGIIPLNSANSCHFLVVMGYTRETQTVPKCGAAEWWITVLLPLCLHFILRFFWNKIFTVITVLHLFPSCFCLPNVLEHGARGQHCPSTGGWHNDEVWVDSHELLFPLGRVEEILKWLPRRYNEPLSSVLHDTFSQIFCLIRAKLKYSNRLVLLMLEPNTQEAYCTFLVFDLSVCPCPSVSSFFSQEEATGHRVTNQECWRTFQVTRWPKSVWIYITLIL